MDRTKNRKGNFLAAFALILALTTGLASACSPKTGATFVTLDREQLTLTVGERAMLSAQTDGFGMKWSSDAEEVATVDDGEVTALSAGEATVTVRVGDVSADCAVTVLPKAPVDPYPVKEGNLCDIYKDHFVIGAAVQSRKLTSDGYGGLMTHFNSISPENNMKWKNVERTKGVCDFNQSGDSADALVAWAKENGVGVRGHCLLWYKSLPTWLHDEFEGAAYSEAVKAAAYGYIGSHIETVMKHFGNDVYVWDVVNEALYDSIDEDKLAASAGAPYGNIWRTDDNMTDADSDWVDWFRVTGGCEYIAYAFRKADEVRTANHLDTELYYNDYGLNNPNKRQACLNLIEMLRTSGAPLDGIGMQAHYKLEDYLADKAGWTENFEASVKAFLEAGVDVQLTELDIRFDGALTDEIEAEQAEMYGKIFEIARKYAKRGSASHGVTGVTLWGVHDGCNEAWGKDKYPLLFGTDRLPKQAYYEVINFTE